MKEKSKMRNGFASVCLLVGAAFIASSHAYSGCDVDYSVANDWGSGAQINVSITNTGPSDINGYTLDWHLGGGETFSNGWNAEFSASGHSISASNPAGHWNGLLRKNGGTSSFGFIISNTSAPADLIVDFTLNGVACGGGAIPTLPPTPVSTPTPTPSITVIPTSTPTPTPHPTVTPTPQVTPTSGGGLSIDIEPIKNGCSGFATRFWDCCKPHCGWQANVHPLTEPMLSCDVNDTPMFDVNAKSSCNGGNAHTCTSLIPQAINDKLAIAYAAVPATGDVCGRCYQIEFTGTGKHDADDPGSQKLRGKTLIVQALNIGYDVHNNQFDIMVPGGGVGAFNACSDQWGIPKEELGAQYGGFLHECKQNLNWNGTHEQYKSCLIDKCKSVFGSRNLHDVEEGCLWYANWFEAADNPNLKFKEISCPVELISGTGMDRRSIVNDIDSSQCN